MAFDDTGGGAMQPTPGQTTMPVPYLVTFSDETVSVEAEIVFADPASGNAGFINKLGYIVVFDADLGDLRYPPVPSLSPEATDDPEDGAVNDTPGDESSGDDGS